MTYKTIKVLELLLACLGKTPGVGLAKDRDRPAARERAWVKDFIVSGLYVMYQQIISTEEADEENESRSE